MTTEPAVEAVIARVDDRGRLGALHPEVARHARRFGADDELAWRATLATHEVCTNIFVHGAGRTAVDLTIAVSRTPGRLQVAIADTTPPFDPTDPEPTEGPGPDGHGLGLTLVRGLADAVDYEACDGNNTTTLEFRARTAEAVHPA